MFTLKKLLYSSCLLISVGLISNCNKRNDSKVKGIISYEFNDTPYKIVSSDDKVIKYNNENNWILIYGAPINEKRITLTTIPTLDTIHLGALNDNNASGKCYINNYDELGLFCNLYHLDTRDSLNNWIKIDEENNDFRHIIGQFSATLFKDSIECSYGNPYGNIDTLRIRDGKFDICD